MVQLLPGGPCEDYVYRFRTLGRLREPFAACGDAAEWWRTRVAREDLAPETWPCDFAETGWSGWHPRSGVGCRLRRAGAAARAPAPLLDTVALRACIGFADSVRW